MVGLAAGSSHYLHETWWSHNGNQKCVTMIFLRRAELQKTIDDSHIYQDNVLASSCSPFTALVSLPLGALSSLYSAALRV